MRKNNFENSKGKNFQSQLNGTWMANPDREKELLLTYSMVNNVVTGGNLETSYSMHEAIPACGTINIEGDYIYVKNPKLFIRMMENADILYVEPKLNGRVGIEISFNGMSQKIGD